MIVTKFKLEKSAIFTLASKQYRMESFIDGVWNCTEVKTGAYQKIRANEILKGYEEGSIKVESASVLRPVPAAIQGLYSMESFDSLPIKEQERLKIRRQFLESLRKDYGEFPTGKSIKYQIQQYWTTENGYRLPQPSVDTVKRWLKRYQASGYSILALKDMTHLRGNKILRLDHKLADLCHQALREIYLRPERGTLKHTLSLASTLIREENKQRLSGQQLPLPTTNTIKSLLNQMCKQEVNTARYGYQSTRVKFRNSVGGQQAERPLERYEIDHTQLDIMVVDELTGIVIGRPWLTLMIDSYAKSIAGFHLSFEPPSCCALAAIFKHAFLPKTYIRELYPEIKNEWNTYGVPESIVADNGMEFHAVSLAEAMMVIGVILTYMPRKTPWFKGTIERVIGTLNRAITSLSAGGRTFHSIEEKGDYNPKKTAVMTMKALEKCITIWIVDVYHQSLHRSIGATPQQKWDAHIDHEEVNFLTDASVLDAITGNICERSLWHYGIELNKVTYNSPELGAVRHHLGLKKGDKIRVRWNSEDLGKITVLLPQGAHLDVPAIPACSSAKGVSLKHYRIARQDLINRQLNPSDNEALDAAITHIHTFSEETAKNTKQVQRQYRREERQAAKEAKLTKKLLNSGNQTQSESVYLPAKSSAPKVPLIPDIGEPLLFTPILASKSFIPKSGD